MSEAITNPIKAIRAKCIDCCCGSPSEVKLCTAHDCNLYPFRLGKNPYRAKRVLSDEQKRVLAERMQNGRNKKEIESK